MMDFVTFDFEAVEWIEFAYSSPKLDKASIHPKAMFFFQPREGPKKRTAVETTFHFDLPSGVLSDLPYFIEGHFTVQTFRGWEH
jgi:hypothetical protein